MRGGRKEGEIFIEWNIVITQIKNLLNVKVIIGNIG
jgi:hypothetical protein